MYGNNAYANANNLYKNNEVMNASPKKLIILLYEGAIKNLKLSIFAMEAKNIEKTNNLLIKAQNILQELMGTLNFQEGGEIANNLYSLYEFMHRCLISANIHKNPEEVRTVIGLLEELKETWEKL